MRSFVLHHISHFPITVSMQVEVETEETIKPRSSPSNRIHETTKFLSLISPVTLYLLFVLHQVDPDSIPVLKTDTPGPLKHIAQLGHG